MGEVIVITSGKGEVGKTNNTDNIGAALADIGKKVALVDGDTGLRNLDILMGFENAVIAADRAIFVVNPEVTSIRDADRVLGMLRNKGIKNHVIV